MQETDFLEQDKGFSLVSVMIALGLAGAVAVLVMKLTTSINKVKVEADSNQDEAMLASTVNLILSNEKHCRLSLLGDGPYGAPDVAPVGFEKKDIDEQGEGLDVELYFGNQVGDKRQTLKLSSTDTKAKKFGRLEIQSIKLLMNNGQGFNYTTSFGHSDVGVLQVNYKKPSGRDIRKDFPLNVSMITNSVGKSFIVSCNN